MASPDILIDKDLIQKELAALLNKMYNTTRSKITRIEVDWKDISTYDQPNNFILNKIKTQFQTDTLFIY